MNTYRFGKFRFDADARLLDADGMTVDLGRRAAHLLQLLLDRRGEVVRKEALIDAVWQGASIEDSNLSVQIARLRKIVGMTGFIETVGRVGYRFRGTERQTEAATLAASLLVAPMLGLDEAGRALAPIFTEDLTTGLARFKSLSLIDSEWSAANVPAASYLLKGAVRCSGRVIQLSLQLIDEATRRIVWSERFGSEARDAAAAVDRIVGGAVPRIESCIRQFELGARADDGEETAEALYRRGSRLARIGRPQENAAAIAFLDRALELAPENVAILAAACNARGYRASMGWDVSPADSERTQALARRGLSLGADDATALSMFGFGLFRSGEQDLGYAVTQRAMAMNPNSLLGHIYAGTTSMHWGRIEVAEATYRRALKLAPADPGQCHVMGGLSRLRMMQGRFEEALNWAQRALSFDQHYGAAHWTRVAASTHLGRHDAALRYLDAFRRSQQGVTVASIRGAQSTRGSRMASTLEGLEEAGL